MQLFIIDTEKKTDLHRNHTKTGLNCLYCMYIHDMHICYMCVNNMIYVHVMRVCNVKYNEKHLIKKYNNMLKPGMCENHNTNKLHICTLLMFLWTYMMTFWWRNEETWNINEHIHATPSNIPKNNAQLCHFFLLQLPFKEWEKQPLQWIEWIL